MKDRVKKRRYVSPLREESQRKTHAKILDAAHALFVANGYVATSIRKIAAQADVAEQTVYSAFADKLSILLAVIMRVLASDEEATSSRQAMSSGTSEQSQIPALGYGWRWSGPAGPTSTVYTSSRPSSWRLRIQRQERAGSGTKCSTVGSIRTDSWSVSSSRGSVSKAGFRWTMRRRSSTPLIPLQCSRH